MERIDFATASRFFVTLIRCLLGKDIYGEEIRQRLMRVVEQVGVSDVAATYSIVFTKNQITVFEKRLFQITTWLFVLGFFSF